MDSSAGSVSTEARRCIESFRGLLRIRCTAFEGPDGTYRQAVDYLRRECEAAGLAWAEKECVKDKPIAVATLEGRDPALPSVVLNCHYDVVPADDSKWSVDPWGGVLGDDGKVYGRGSQDMKSVVMQYIEALRRIKAAGVSLLRTVHITFVPDEEIGGTEGWGLFLATDLFKSLNIGMALDEGLAHPSDKYTVFYGERTPWWVIVEAQGATGHGSRFIKGTAMEKLLRTISRFMKFREEQENELGKPVSNGRPSSVNADRDEVVVGCRHCVAKKLGDVVTVNLTAMKAGVTADGGYTYALNCIPINAMAGFDIRVPPCVDLDEMKSKFDSWCREDGVSWKFAHWTQPLFKHRVTVLDSTQNMWWKTFSNVFSQGKCKRELEEEIFPAATDSRFIRSLGVPCFGFSPMRQTPILLHDHDEYIDTAVYLEGIEVYEELVTALANTPTYEGECSPMNKVADRYRSQMV